jgi:glyoxylase-like metal-dependent hydrolase (beta-lactamase superfamily II)
VLISGDTLFEGSLGRTDLPTGSSRQIVESILYKLLVLPDDTLVYPGHGGMTTIKFEKVYNPVVAYAKRNNL